VQLPRNLSVRQEQAEDDDTSTAVRERSVQAMSEATVSALCDYVRSHLPVRARLLGRERVDAVTSSAIKHWPAEEMLANGVDAVSGDTASRVVAAVAGECRYEGQGRHGSVLLSMLLMSLISAVVQLLLKWWLERPANRVKMTAWQREAKGYS
jgi:hypothetical protein